MGWFKKKEKSNREQVIDGLNKLSVDEIISLVEEYLEVRIPKTWQIIPRKTTSEKMIKKLSFLNDIDNALLQLRENTWDKDLVDLIRGIIGHEYTEAELFLSTFDKKEYERFKKCQKTQ